MPQSLKEDYYRQKRDFRKIYRTENLHNNFLKKKAQKKSKKISPIALIILFLFVISYFGLICPYNYKNYLEPLFVNRFLNRNLTFDISQYVNPTRDYLYNSFLIDRYLLAPITPARTLNQIQISSELTSLKQKVENLASQHPKFHPSVFVFEYSTGKGFEINGDEIFPSASIIKIPIAFELIRLIDKTSQTINPITLDDKRVFKEEYRTEGSGGLQYTKADVAYSIDHLASIMIANSDNSATNMLLEEIGGIDGFNRSMRNLGLKVTSMHNWLPDYDGTNKITAREISTILYNIDNPNYIKPEYRNILKEYLGNTRNIHLIKEKLPKDTMVFHKTGNIGEMIGDSGIVYTDNGKKYIVTILLKRPKNDYSAKFLVQDISLMIYNDIKNLI